jgi:hypothetical protein
MEGVYYQKMERQGRLRIPTKFLAGLPWLPSKAESPRMCRGWIGKYQQLQVAPTPSFAAAHEELVSSLNLEPARVKEANAAWVDLARYSFTTWNVRCSYETGADRLTLTLPKQLQNLKILSPNGSLVASFWIGEILELWVAENWIARAAEFAKDQEDATEKALESLDERQPVENEIRES